MLVALLAVAPAAWARDPGRWLLTGVSSVPTSYWQGLSSDGQGDVVFAGLFGGLWRTTAELRQTGGVATAIPPEVKLAEGYNHIGDIGYDGTEGGRLLLPLECYVPGRGNSCGTGAIGVADPRTLAWRYYVRLSPTEITKAMWVEPAPDGGLLWTSSGSDLLAYRAAAVSSSNAAALPITAAYRLGGAVPASGVSGATFWRGRLLLAGQQGPRYQLWAVDLASGRRTLELELRIRGESEGLHAMSTLGGELHWLIAPFDLRGPATYGPGSALLHFVPAHGRAGLRVSLSARPRGGRLVVAVRVLRRRRPVAGAHVTFGGRFARTDGRGRAELAVVLPRAGRYRALARKGLLRGLSGWVFVRPAPPAGGAAARRSGGG